MKPYTKRISRIGLTVLLMSCCATLVPIANAGPKVVDAIVIKFKNTAFDKDTGKLKPEIDKAITDKNTGIAPKAKLRPMIDPKRFAELQTANRKVIGTNGKVRLMTEEEFAKHQKGKTNVASSATTGSAGDVKRARMNYYALDGEFADHRTNVVARLIDKKDVLEIETAYPAPAVSNPTHVDPPIDPRGTLHPAQHHLDDAPRGVGATNAWRQTPAGACGAQMHLIDLEAGWSLTHKSIAGHRRGRLWSKNVDRENWHGNSVLGTICGKDDQPKGILGVAPHVASVQVISHSGKSSMIAEAIAEAANNLPIGGVLVIEAQLNPFKDRTYQPVEIEDYIYTAIWDAVHIKEIVVIEAAGNGDLNLDTIPTLDRRSNAAPFRDSGAIMVAGGSIIGPGKWGRWARSNYGSRIDNFAEAERAPTAWHPDDETYWEKFNGTSLATAIIAGVALSTQGIHYQKHRYILDGLSLRTVLTNTANATASDIASPPWMIGVMPDLMKIHGNL